MTSDAHKIRLLMHLRRSGVTDTGVLGTIERIPRERFVPPAFADKAYEDTALPIGSGQTISQPLVVASMTAALKLTDRQVVLEVGTGSGYQTAMLAMLCRRVYSLELRRELSREAEGRLAELRLSNTVLKIGDGSKGWPEQAPFDRIIVTAVASEPPPLLLAQLQLGGIMVIPLGDDVGGQQVVRLTRTEEGIMREALFPARFVPLVMEKA